MAQTARLDADIHALEILADRFDALAVSRGKEIKHTEQVTQMLSPLPAQADHSAAKVENYYPPCPEIPAGKEFADAWQMACQHVSKRYALPESIRHPAVVSECYHLACMLLAYGLVPERTPQANFTPARTPTENAIPEVSVSDHRVIVVDDVPDVLVSVGAFLVNAGFTVRKASNGDDALRVIVSDPLIDVLITDFAMPGLNGVDLITQAQQTRPWLKALIITAYPNADGLGDLPTGISVLSKPFRRNALIAAVNSLVRSESAEGTRSARQPETVSAQAEWQSVEKEVRL
jgi:CheY-like chemotaxis protein